MQSRFLFGCCIVLITNTAAAEPRFTRVNVEDHIYGGGWEHFVGGGVAAFDCDGDRFPELLAAGGENPMTLFRNNAGKNGGSVAFDAATPKELTLSGVSGVYPLDIDSDGLIDLAVLRVGENQLMRGIGNCRFEPFPSELGFVSGDNWTTSFSATWERDNRLPTLAFGNYVDRSDPKGPFEACNANYLYRPVTASYIEPKPLTPGHCTLSMLFSNWSRQTRADLRVSNDRHYYVRGGQEQMWAMDTTPWLYGEEHGWRPYSIWGMGIAARDVTGDGFAEVYLTSMGDQKLQSLTSGAMEPTFLDATYERGTTAHRPYTGGDGRPSTGWHVAFGDVQNDGLDDIFVAKGNVDQMPGSAMKDPNNLLVQQPDGTFIESGDAAGIATMDRSRGAALADFNLDGLLDLAVVNRRAALEVYENTSVSDGNWLLLDVSQSGPNTSAIGAFVEVTADGQTRVQEITIGGGHAGGVSGPLHFGLGTTEKVDVRVIWPDTRVAEWTGVVANQIFQVSR